MCVYLCAKFEVSCLILMSFRQNSSIQIPKVKIPLKLTLTFTLNESNIGPKYFSPKMTFPLNPLNLVGILRGSF